MAKEGLPFASPQSFAPNFPPTELPSEALDFHKKYMEFLMHSFAQQQNDQLQPNPHPAFKKAQSIAAFAPHMPSVPMPVHKTDSAARVIPHSAPRVEVGHHPMKKSRSVVLGNSYARQSSPPLPPTCERTATAPTPPHAQFIKTSSLSTMRQRAPRVTWSALEDQIILNEVEQHGFKWTQIASMLNKRTDDAVRNRWHRIMKKQHSTTRPADYNQNQFQKTLIPLQ